MATAEVENVVDKIDALMPEIIAAFWRWPDDHDWVLWVIRGAYVAGYEHGMEHDGD